MARRARFFSTRLLLPLGIVLAVMAAAAPGWALWEIGPGDEIARQAVLLSAGSGESHPVDRAMGLLDDEVYADAYRKLARRGFVHPFGEKLADWVDARADKGGFTLLVPDVLLRSYYLSGVEKDVLPHGTGTRLARGFTQYLTVSGGLAWSDWVGMGYAFRVDDYREGLSARVDRLYLKTELGKWSLKVGRDAERLGPGVHGNLLLDADAPTYLLVRLRSEEPLFLPWIFENIGAFRVLLMNAWLDDDAPSVPDSRYAKPNAKITPNPQVLAFRLSYHPTYWIDFGVTRAVFHDGDGRKSRTSLSDWMDLITGTNENPGNRADNSFDTDQYAGVDLTIRMPALNGVGPLKGGELYVQYGGGDLYAVWQGDNTGGWEPMRFNQIGTLLGGYLSTARSDLRIEYAVTDTQWYSHHIYGQGYTYRGIGLGHHMGGDAENWFAALGHYFSPRYRAEVSLDWEKRGRHLPVPERRAEVATSLEARKLELFGLTFQAKLDVSYTAIDKMLDTLPREDRERWRVGVSLDSVF